MDSAQKTSYSSSNASLQLEQFDYENLVGEPFKKYQDFIDQLAPNDQPSKDLYDFDEYRAWPTFDDSNQKVVGVMIIGFPDPIRTVRIEARHARLHNQQIANAQSRANGGLFLLLKK